MPLLAGIDLNLLLALDALVAEESVGKAARKVGLSPSAMSHALGRLRDVVGDPLLVRTGLRMRATPRARAMGPRIAAALTEIGQAIAPEPAFDPAAETRTVRIAAVDFVQSTLFSRLLKWLERRAPRVDFAVLPFGPTSFKDVAAGDVDLAFAQHYRAPGLHERVVLSEPFVCVLRRGHPALARKLTAARFAQLGHVLVSPRGRSPGAVDRALKKRGLARRVVLAVPNFLAAALVVADSDLVLTAGVRSAQRLATALGLVTVAPPVALPPFQVGMYWHERTEHDAFLSWLRAGIEEVLGAER
jgi:DNA-binding transcriptional LysR family regulator